MERLQNTAHEAGFHVMVAGVSSANSGGLAFHKSLGFGEVGRMPEVGFKRGKWLDLILMQKFLGADDDTGTDTDRSAG